MRLSENLLKNRYIGGLPDEYRVGSVVTSSGTIEYSITNVPWAHEFERQLWMLDELVKEHKLYEVDSRFDESGCFWYKYYGTEKERFYPQPWPPCSLQNYDYNNGLFWSGINANLDAIYPIFALANTYPVETEDFKNCYFIAPLPVVSNEFANWGELYYLDSGYYCTVELDQDKSIIRYLSSGYRSREDSLPYIKHSGIYKNFLVWTDEYNIAYELGTKGVYAFYYNSGLFRNGSFQFKFDPFSSGIRLIRDLSQFQQSTVYSVYPDGTEEQSGRLRFALGRGKNIFSVHDHSDIHDQYLLSIEQFDIPYFFHGIDSLLVSREFISEVGTDYVIQEKSGQLYTYLTNNQRRKPIPAISGMVRPKDTQIKNADLYLMKCSEWLDGDDNIYSRFIEMPYNIYSYTDIVLGKNYEIQYPGIVANNRTNPDGFNWPDSKLISWSGINMPSSSLFHVTESKVDHNLCHIGSNVYYHQYHSGLLEWSYEFLAGGDRLIIDWNIKPTFWKHDKTVYYETIPVQIIPLSTRSMILVSGERENINEHLDIIKEMEKEPFFDPIGDYSSSHDHRTHKYHQEKYKLDQKRLKLNEFNIKNGQEVIPYSQFIPNINYSPENIYGITDDEIDGILVEMGKTYQEPPLGGYALSPIGRPSFSPTVQIGGRIIAEEEYEIFVPSHAYGLFYSGYWIREQIQTRSLIGRYFGFGSNSTMSIGNLYTQYTHENPFIFQRYISDTSNTQPNYQGWHDRYRDFAPRNGPSYLFSTSNGGDLTWFGENNLVPIISPKREYFRSYAYYNSYNYGFLGIFDRAIELSGNKLYIRTGRDVHYYGGYVRDIQLIDTGIEMMPAYNTFTGEYLNRSHYDELCVLGFDGREIFRNGEWRTTYVDYYERNESYFTSGVKFVKYKMNTSTQSKEVAFEMIPYENLGGFRLSGVYLSNRDRPDVELAPVGTVLAERNYIHRYGMFLFGDNYSIIEVKYKSQNIVTAHRQVEEDRYPFRSYTVCEQQAFLNVEDLQIKPAIPFSDVWEMGISLKPGTDVGFYDSLPHLEFYWSHRVDIDGFADWYEENFVKNLPYKPGPFKFVYGYAKYDSIIEDISKGDYTEMGIIDHDNIFPPFWSGSTMRPFPPSGYSSKFSGVIPIEDIMSKPCPPEKDLLYFALIPEKITKDSFEDIDFYFPTVKLESKYRQYYTLIDYIRDNGGTMPFMEVRVSHPKKFWAPIIDGVVRGDLVTFGQYTNFEIHDYGRPWWYLGNTDISASVSLYKINTLYEHRINGFVLKVPYKYVGMTSPLTNRDTYLNHTNEEVVTTALEQYYRSLYTSGLLSSGVRSARFDNEVVFDENNRVDLNLNSDTDYYSEQYLSGRLRLHYDNLKNLNALKFWNRGLISYAGSLTALDYSLFKWIRSSGGKYIVDNTIDRDLVFGSVFFTHYGTPSGRYPPHEDIFF